MLGDLGRVCSPLPSCFAVFQRKFQLFSAVFRMFSISLQPISCWLRGFFAFCSSFQFIFMFSIIFSAISSSPPAVDTGASVVTAVWTYVGELAFNLLVLVGAIKGCDRIVKEIMGL